MLFNCYCKISIAIRSHSISAYDASHKMFGPKFMSSTPVWVIAQGFEVLPHTRTMILVTFSPKVLRGGIPFIEI